MRSFKKSNPQSTYGSAELVAGCDSQSDNIWALRDVSFEVGQGEVVGIIGRNGAGKSTLLKILSKITEPTDGRVELRGRVGSLLEVGTGFHPELTGHENIYLYGAILGMDRWEVTGKFDEIVAFAELEKFIDAPVKRYSSGMYMRLAFAVAAHLETEILLVDEVLAVGDLDFQKKCLGKMDIVSKEGRTVLFVSHNMGAIRNLCDNAILLFSGGIKNQGNVDEVISGYEDYETSKNGSIWVNDNLDEKNEIAFLKKIELLNQDFKITNTFSSSESILIKFTLVVKESNDHLKLGFDLIKNGDIIFRSQQVDSPQMIKTLQIGTHSVFCEIPAYLLNSGIHYIRPLLSIHLQKLLIKDSIPVLKFRVVLDSSKSDFHFVLNENNHPGFIFPYLNWKLE
ncbi:MAG: ATP-binding cassette domain-containing protein [Desulfobacterales bacterium]|nr:MAG: ATP-binding cassette domain-containing protein [Desulfobacterales bacterium]